MSFTALNDYMIPCLNKKLLGVDCLGCGIQRAFSLLLTGNLGAAFKMFPAIYPLAFFGIFLIVNIFVKIKYAETIKAVLMISSILLIILNYIFKNFI